MFVVQGCQQTSVTGNGTVRPGTIVQKKKTLLEALKWNNINSKDKRGK